MNDYNDELLEAIQGGFASAFGPFRSTASAPGFAQSAGAAGVMPSSQTITVYEEPARQFPELSSGAVADPSAIAAPQFAESLNNPWPSIWEFASPAPEPVVISPEAAQFAESLGPIVVPDFSQVPDFALPQQEVWAPPERTAETVLLENLALTPALRGVGAVARAAGLLPGAGSVAPSAARELLGGVGGGFAAEVAANVLEDAPPLVQQAGAMLAGGLTGNAIAPSRAPVLSAVANAATPSVHVPPPAAPNLQYVSSLRPFDEVLSEVTTRGDVIPAASTLGQAYNRATEVARNIAGGLGINPSLLNDTDVGKAVTAYMRQRVAADELGSVAVSAAIDPHTQRFTGRTGGVMPIDNDGLMRVAPKTARMGPEVKGVAGKTPWNDVFSKPDAFDLKPETRAYIDDFNAVVKQVEDMRVGAGLSPRAMLDDQGRLYVPRQVKTAHGVELQRPSSASLQRTYDEALDGFERGIRYDKDPRATLELHVKQAYREVIEKQLEDAMTPLIVKPSELVSPAVRARYAAAATAKLEAERALRREGAAVQRYYVQMTGGDVAAALREVNNAKRAITRIQGELGGRGQLAAGRRQTPVSYGERIADANARLRAADLAYDDALDVKRSVPRGKAGAERMVADSTRDAVQKARDEFYAAKNAHTKAMEAAMKDEIAPKGFFAPNVKAARQALANARDAAAEASKAHRAAKPVDRPALWATVQQARNDLKAAQGDYNEAVRLATADGEVIPISMWRNRFLPREDADVLVDKIGAYMRKGENKDANWVAKIAGGIGNYTRFLASIGDFSMPFIQGLPVLATEPGTWAKGTAMHYRAFLDPTVQGRFIKDHLDTFQAMARNGVPIGDPEFFAALREGGGLSAGRLLGPARGLGQNIGKQTFGRFGSSYNAGLGAYRAMLWESSKMGEKAKAQWIRNLTGGLDTRALGVGPNQRNIEGMWLAFSPRLLRSTAGLVADAMRPGTPEGRAALRSLTGLLVAAHGLYALSGVAMGKDQDEIERGLNPLNGKKYLSHEINGDWIGVGGQVRAITQMVAHSVAAGMRGDVDAFASLDRYDNPLLSFYTSRGAPALNMAQSGLEAASGGSWDANPYANIDNLPDLVKHLGTSAFPFALQGHLEGQNAMTTLAAILGARTSPETPSEALAAQREAVEMEYGSLFPPAVAEAIRGLDYFDLGPRERAVVDGYLRETAPNVLKDYEEQRRERGSVFQKVADQQAAFVQTYVPEMDELLAGLFGGGDPKKIMERYDDIKNQMSGGGKALRNSEEYKKALAGLEDSALQKKLEEWYSIPERLTVNGVPQWDKVDAVRTAYLEQLAQQDRGLANRLAFNIQDTVNPNEHKLIQFIDSAQKYISAYYDVPEKQREAWRASHPKEDYVLWLLGYTTTVRSPEAAQIAQQTTSGRTIRLVR